MIRSFAFVPGDAVNVGPLSIGTANETIKNKFGAGSHESGGVYTYNRYPPGGNAPSTVTFVSV